jgi:FixJ family two-component response regulator
MLASSDGPIGLLLTDAVMPEINGCEAADRVQALRPGTPVVFMSGYGEAIVGPSLMTGPSRSFLSKPFRSDELIACIERGLSLRAGRSS